MVVLNRIDHGLNVLDGLSSARPPHKSHLGVRVFRPKVEPEIMVTSNLERKSMVADIDGRDFDHLLDV